MTTGNDPIEAEVKGSNRLIHFTWGGKHLFIANDLPEAKGEADTDAFYNRIKLVEFVNQIPREEQDPDLIDKLTSPEELSGILNWAIDGLKRLEERGRFIKDPLEKTREKYKRAASPVYAFVRDHCIIDIKEFTPKEESYTTYVKYCHHHNLPPKGKTRFYEELLRHCAGIMTDRETVGKRKPQVWRYLKIQNTEHLDVDPTNPGQTQL